MGLERAGAASLHSRVRELFGLALGLAVPYLVAPSFAHTYFLSDQPGRGAATADM